MTVTGNYYSIALVLLGFLISFNKLLNRLETSKVLVFVKLTNQVD